MRTADRRTFLRLLALGLAGGLAGPAAGGALPRLAAIDWAMLETAVALGLPPVAACELIRFREDAVEPRLAPETVDLGLRGAPNFELLQLVRPDIILSSPYYPRHLPRLEPIAPVLSLPFYIQGEAPLSKALSALEDLARSVDLPGRGTDARRKVEAELGAIASRLVARAGRPAYIVNIGDSRHFRAFGADSMFGNVLDRLGLPNAWTEESRFSFAAPVPIERLAGVEDARIVIVSDVPVEAEGTLSRSLLWNALRPVAEGRVLRLPNVNPFGGVLAALRFARQLEAALSREGGA